MFSERGSEGGRRGGGGGGEGGLEVKIFSTSVSCKIFLGAPCQGRLTEVVTKTKWQRLSDRLPFMAKGAALVRQSERGQISPVKDLELEELEG
jgi:hypothetical protein